MSYWYYYKNNKKLGPVSTIELAKLAETGEISRNTILDCNGMQIPAEKVQGLNFAQKQVSPKERIANNEPGIPPIPNQPSSSTAPASNSNYSKYNQQQGYSSSGQAQGSQSYIQPQRHSSHGNAPVNSYGTETKRGVSPLGVVSFVMGLIASLFTLVPFLRLIAWPLGVIGLILALIGIILLDRGRTSMSFPVAGCVTCSAAIAFACFATFATNKPEVQAKNEPVNSSSSDSPSELPTSPQLESDNDKAVAIEITQQEMIKDVLRFSIDSMEFSKKVAPEGEDDYSSYYEADDGYTYIVVSATFRNLTTDPKDLYNIPANFLLNGKDFYPATVKIDSAQYGFHSTYPINPHETALIVFMASVPDEIAKEFESGVMEFGFNDDLKFDSPSSIDKMERQYRVNLKLN